MTHKYNKDKLNDHIRVTATRILHSDMSEGHYNSIGNSEAISRAIDEVKRQASIFDIELNPEDIDSDYLNKHLDSARIWI